MGKLLHKLLHGMLPSWITKLKVSTDHTSPKKLLPFFRASGRAMFSKFLQGSSQSDTTCPNTPSGSVETTSGGDTEQLAGSREQEARKRKSEWLDGESLLKKARKTEATAGAELPECLREVVGDSSAVVKYAEDPHKELWESMVEMIVGNGLWHLGSLECLLYCYLSLNPPPLHDMIEETFLTVLKDLDTTSSSSSSIS